MLKKIFQTQYIRTATCLLFLCIFCIAFAIQFNCLDFDLFSRLIAGKHILQTGFPLFDDIVSFMPVHTWYDPEWLSSAFLYVIIDKYSTFGFNLSKGIFLFFIVLSTILASKAYNNKKIEYPEFFFILPILILSANGLLYYRCQFFTFLFLALWIYCLEKIRKGNNKFIFILPFIMLIWLNCHAGCLTGIGILIFYIIGEFINKKSVKNLALILIPTLLVYFINPWKIEYIKFLFNSLFIDRSYILEWGSPLLFPFAYKIYFLIFIFLTFIIYGYNLFITKKIDYSKLITFLVFFITSMIHLKLAPLCSIIACIYCYNDYINVFSKIKLKYLKFIFTLLIYLSVTVGSIFIFLNTAIEDSHKDRTIKEFPIIPVAFLDENNIKGNLFTLFYNAGFVAYKTYPNIKIAIDGREEQVYSENDINEYLDFIFHRNNKFYKFILNYNPDIFLCDKEWAFVNFFKENEGYENIYEDNFYAIYIKSTLKKDKYEMPKHSTSYYINRIFDTKIDFNDK